MKKRLRNLLMATTFLALCLPLIANANNYTANTIPNLGGAYLVFAGKMGGEISKKDLVKQTELEVSGCAAGSKIFEYTLYITKNGKTQSFQANDCLLSNEVCTLLKSLAAGDTFEFKKIKARLPKGDGIVDVRAKKFRVV